jgi:hypothetical protein
MEDNTKITPPSELLTFLDTYVEKSMVEEGKKFAMWKRAHPEKEGRIDAKKSKIKKFPTIGAALAVSNYGQVFTTPQSDRIYVITKGTWGKKSQNKVVKGFTADTPFSKIKGYSDRTKTKHAGSQPSADMKTKQKG